MIVLFIDNLNIRRKSKALFRKWFLHFSTWLKALLWKFAMMKLMQTVSTCRTPFKLVESHAIWNQNMYDLRKYDTNKWELFSQTFSFIPVEQNLQISNKLIGFAGALCVRNWVYCVFRVAVRDRQACIKFHAKNIDMPCTCRPTKTNAYQINPYGLPWKRNAFF